MPNPLLMQRAVLLSKMEGTYNQDAGPTPELDAMLVSDPGFTVDPTVIERNFTRSSLSTLRHRVGRKLAGMKATIEFKGSGSVTTAPRAGRYLRTAGYAETQITAGAAQVGAMRRDPTSPIGPVVAWGTPTMGAVSPPEPILYRIDVTTGGPSGTARVSITPDLNAVANGYDAVQTNVAITSAAALPLKSTGNGAGITPTFTGNLVLGQRWYAYVYPVGWLYTPISTGFESATNYLYWDGNLHKMPGARSTFTMEGTAGQTPTMVFTFTGQYVPIIAAALPVSAVFEGTLPPIIENANLTIDEFQAVVNKFSFDQGNQINVREDVSKPDGYNGVNITGRDPKGGIDPEMTLVSDQDFWDDLTKANAMPFRMRFGSDVGNRQWVLAGGVQYTGLSYQNRNSKVVLDAGLKFPTWLNGDDEVQFFFG